MTLKEAARELRLSPQTLYKNFYPTQERLKKKGVLITKWGYGTGVEYEIEYMEDEEEI